MSFFSRSDDRNSYRNPNYGSGHYKKRGVFEKLGGMFGSFSQSPGGYYRQQPYPEQNLYQPQRSAASAHCPSCGADVPGGSKFCLECGAKINVGAVCGSCGQPISGNAKFCPNCGAARR